MTKPRSLLALAALCLGPVAGAAPPEPAAPPPPAKYDAVVRYEINAFRNQRVAQFGEMVRTLTRFGFAKGEGPEDEVENRAVTRMPGVVASADARKLLRARHVQALRLLPAGTAPLKGDDPVRVELELAAQLPFEPGRYLYGTEAVRRLESSGGPALARQRLLADQARSVLTKLGFREAVSYDTRAHTRLVGGFPAGKVEALLDDLRTQEGGADQPAPFASHWPLLVVEAMPGVPVPAPTPAPPALPPAQEKLTPELRAALGEDADRPRRLEVILWLAPDDADQGWQRDLLRTAPNAVLEGRAGPLVSLLVPPSQAPALAASPVVSTVRLPRSSQPRLTGANPRPDAARDVVGRRGRGTTVAVVDGDFRGWEALVGKGLPKATRLLDLTAERNADLTADPFVGDPGTAGPGTRAALAATSAAPLADLLLVRVDPSAPYQFLSVARALNGDPVRSLNLARRSDELQTLRARLDERQARLVEERRAAFEASDDFEEAEKRRQAYRENHKKLEADERDYQGRAARYLRLEEGLRDLAKARTVACGLSWNEGHPVDGGGALAQYLDGGSLKALWFQAAGDTRGQAWAGTFRDAGGDGVMEFLDGKQPLPDGLWGRTPAFLSWRAADGRAAAELPAGARLRLSVQWREPHDPEFLRRGEDAYRTPLAPLDLVVLRQLDPAGKARPADDFQVVAQSAGLPQRLDNRPESAVYEQTVELVVPAAGRYAVQVRGRVPAGIRPKAAATLPALEQAWDLRARVFIETLDGAGRGVFRDFATAEGSLGTPADARHVITVGAATPSSAPGPVFGLALLPKPDFVAPAPAGADSPAAFAAGVAASFGEGAARGPVLQFLRAPTGAK